MIQKPKATTSIRVDVDLLNEARKQKINVSLITEEAIKVSIGKPTIEFLQKQRGHIEEELNEINKKIEELEREKKTQEEIAERKRKEAEIEQTLVAEADGIMLLIKKELLTADTKEQIFKVMDTAIRKYANGDNPHIIWKLKDSRQHFGAVFDQKRWENYKRSFRRELGLKIEGDEE
jgi:Skp family chaperone for outer membrane proteins